MEEPRVLKITKHGFDKFDLHKIPVSGGGNCYFHGILMAYSIPYRTQKLGGRPLKRIDAVRSLRKDLSLRLTSNVDPDDETSPTVYESLGGGHMAVMGEETKELNIINMISHIDSDEWCGEEVQELVSNELEKNIFYIDVKNKDVYCTSNIDFLYKNRPSVVLIYDGGHYDTCALKNKHGEYVTHFKFSNPFIQFLYNRLINKKC